MAITLGFLEQLSTPSGSLEVAGWMASTGLGRLTGVRAEVPGAEVRAREVSVGLASPDVRAAHPEAQAAESCRFQASFGVEGLAETAPGMILITPVFERGEGRTWAKFPGLQNPPDDESAFVGGGGPTVAEEFLVYFLEQGQLRPDSSILDVGCGVGRMALPLTRYLSPEGRYDGFDPSRTCIDWCREHITPSHPNFTFTHVDLGNPAYNPRGRMDASRFRFPYEDDAFDFSFLTSVFTHLKPDTVRTYLGELRRVQKTPSRTLVTAFVLRDDSRALMAAGKSTKAFEEVSGEEYFTANPEIHEDAIGFREEVLHGWIRDAGFTIERFLPGAWCGRPPEESYQDIFVLTAD